MRILLILLFVVTGCKEFHDEDFQKFQEEEAVRTTTSVNGNGKKTNYTATLKSTDQTLPKLEGTANVYVEKGMVKVDVRMAGVPANFIQIHYTFLTAPCQNLSYKLPADVGNRKTRSYNLFEELSTDALAADLASSGASSAQRDINLQGKSVVVKAFYNFSGIPGSGTNQLTIACGALKVSNTKSDDENLGNPYSDLN